MIKICPNRGQILQNKLRNMWTALLNISTITAGSQDQEQKQYEQKAIRAFGLAMGK